MRILWVATKIPWPPIDGGRLLLYNTLKALAAAGHDVTLAAPTLGTEEDAARAAAELRPYCRLVAVPARLRPRALDAARAQLLRRPWTIVRHSLPAMRRRVAELVLTQRFDVVQAEQVQALGSLDGPGDAPPVVWRAQNVESDLWKATADEMRWRRPLFRLEARRLARWEGEAVRRTAATIALTAEDASRLGELSAAQEKIHRVAAPFAAELPAAGATLPGSPAVVLFGSGGWLPNRRGALWFLRQVWPRVHEAAPGAVLHVFGGRRFPPRSPPRGPCLDGGEAVEHHPPPADSREALPPGAVLAVPLLIASGVRMKILEAWSRGIPVVATPAAARGLAAVPGKELLVAETADAFAAALLEIHDRPRLASSLSAAARELLRRDHSFEQVARELQQLYAALLSPASGSSASPCPRPST